MRAVLAGASGFLGSNVRARLARDGYEIVQLVRRAPTDTDQRRWDPDAGELDPAVLADADLVVNMCGAGVEDKRWTDAYRQTLITSRVRPTRTLAATIAGLPPDQRPKVLVNSSAIGFYGDTGDTPVDEDSPAGVGYFPDLCQAWESATAPAAQAGVRVVLLRTGLVLDARAGLLRPLSIVTRLFAGGPLAGGQHWMPWISLRDWVDAVRFVIDRDDISGPVNVVGPDPVRNNVFTKALGKALHRPTPWPVPKFALKIVLGDFADEAVANQRVLPGVLRRSGFVFQDSTVDEALATALS